MADFEDHLVQPILESIQDDFQHMNVDMSIDSLRYGRQVVSRPNMPLEDWQIDAYNRTVRYVKTSGKLNVNQHDQDYGTYLLDLLLSKQQWKTIFGSFLRRAQNEVLLDITASDPDLLVYPWEVCAHANWQQLDLPIPPNDIIVVRTPGPYQDKWPAREPIRILVAGVSSYELSTPNFEKEKRAIIEGLESAGLQRGLHYEIQLLRETTYLKLRRNVSEFKPHVVHLVTHGEGGKHYLESSDGYPILIPSNQLAGALRPGNESFCLFVSTACMSMEEVPTENVWGLGRLLASMFPVTIGMQLAITEEAALAFISTLYSELGTPNRVLEAYVAARERVRSIHPGSPEWIAPVLYRGSPYNELLFSPRNINYYLRTIIAEIDNKLELLLDPNKGFDLSLDSGLWKETYNLVNKIEKILIGGLEKGILIVDGQKKSSIRLLKTSIRNLRTLLFNICYTFERLNGRDRKLGDNISRAITDLSDLRNDLVTLYTPDDEEFY